MKTADETAAIQREIRIAARPETVFAFLTDPAKMVRWKGKEATLEPRPGGIYRVEINDQAIARGTAAAAGRDPGPDAMATPAASGGTAGR